MEKDRKFFIDWLRIFLILSVFIYHIGMYFNTWNWHVKNNVEVTWFNEIMKFLHLWRMPLLFLVSGVGTYYALGFRTVKTFLKERFIRILLPLIIGVFTLVPVQVYLERSNEYGSLFQYYGHMFDGVYPKGNFSWHHLWFLVYLFLIALIISPFLNYLRGERFQNTKQKLVRLSSKFLGLNWVLILLIGSQLILRQFFPVQTNALYNDWAYFTYYFLYFIAGVILFTDKNLIKILTTQRHWYALECILLLFVFNLAPKYLHQIEVINNLSDILEISIAWTCCISVLGYSKFYLDNNSKWRKIGNEGIYPFYLLHQPVIIIIGFLISGWEIPILTKIGLLLFMSFSLIILIYWFIIRPINALRVIFGLKSKSKT